MWPFTRPIRLIRYLLVWRVNSSLVRMPRCPSAELSLVLGSTIADRLPTRQAQPWRKALAPWDECGGLSFVGQKKGPPPPEASWPVEAVLHAYPGKSTYGPGEVILWELELLGESADHGLFLEVILPAMEDVGSTSKPQWQHHNSLWGHFDIQAIYAARGPHWEPLVRDGRLDLACRVTPVQWVEGMVFGLRLERIFDRLTWLTPFDLGLNPKGGGRKKSRKRQKPDRVPTLRDMLESLIARMSVLLPGKSRTPADLWDVLGAEEHAAFQAVLEQVSRIPVHHADLKRAPRHWPTSCWMGAQTFPSVPHPAIPYLELASILHVGKHTHLGCGTFTIG